MCFRSEDKLLAHDQHTGCCSALLVERRSWNFCQSCAVVIDFVPSNARTIRCNRNIEKCCATRSRIGPPSPARASTAAGACTAARAPGSSAASAGARACTSRSTTPARAAAAASRLRSSRGRIVACAGRRGATCACATAASPKKKSKN